MARSFESRPRRVATSSMRGSSLEAEKKDSQSGLGPLMKCWRAAASASTPSRSNTTAGPVSRAAVPGPTRVTDPLTQGRQVPSGRGLLPEGTYFPSGRALLHSVSG